MALPDDVILRIKAATRDLVKACGGIVRAAELCRVSKSEMGRYQAPIDPDIVPLHHALVLETECGMPVVTTVMADIHGRRLSDPQAVEAGACVFARNADLMRQTAALMGAAATAAADGTCTPSEAEILDRHASEVEAAARLLRRDLSAVKAGVFPARLRAVE
jgi:hypothetical protein